LVLNCPIINKCRGILGIIRPVKYLGFIKKSGMMVLLLKKKHYRKFFDLLKTFFRYANNIQDGTVITTY